MYEPTSDRVLALLREIDDLAPGFLPALLGEEAKFRGLVPSATRDLLSGRHCAVQYSNQKAWNCV